MTIRARVIDPAGPMGWRIVTLLAGLGPLAIALPFGFEASAAVAMLAVAWTFWARLVLPPLRARDAQLHAEPGVLRIAKAGVVSQRIAAREVRAASIATTERGVSIALIRGVAGDRPILIELESREDATALRRALGIGVHGFGEVRWPSPGAPSDWTLPPLRALASLGWIAMAAAMLLGPIELVLGLALGVVPLTIISVAMAAAGAGRPAMRRATRPELEHAAASAKEAAERAMRVETTAPATTLAPLARAGGETSRAWLERVDAMAASLVEDDGYRRAGLDPRDLWDTLVDPDASPPLRAVAARVLARVAPEEARLRIGTTLSVERDPDTRAGIRVALEEDVEVAARGLDRLGRA